MTTHHTLRTGLLALAGTLAMAMTACGTAPGSFQPGQTDFVSANPNGGGGRYGSPQAGGAADGGTANAGGTATGGTTTTRTIEEGDIVRTDGTLLYVLNQYRGLQIIDVSTPDSPRLLGMAPIFGQPIEMYIRGTRAYVVVSNYYDYWMGPLNGGAAVGVSGFRGSQIRVVDIADPSAPMITGKFDMPGNITDTRIVGDVLYAVSKRYPTYDASGVTTTTEGTYIDSIDIADPQNIHQVDELSFPSQGWDNHVNVTTQAIFVSSTGYDYNNGNGGYTTQIQYVDISDPAGKLALGGGITLPGMVRDRWMLDFDTTSSVFRVVTAPDWNGSAPEIDTFSIGAGGTFTKLGHTALILPHPEAVTAVRFDGPVAYVVTSERIDPLFVVDLSDPANPVQRGDVTMPGWIDYIEPRGDRLVALGHDNSTGSWQLAVSLFDVSNLDQPSLIKRVLFGQNWGWVPDSTDNMQKIFKVLDNLGLIMVPFESYSYDSTTGYWKDASGVQLIDFGHDTLNLRGLIGGGGLVRRAIPYQNRVLTVSDQRMQTVDITNRDNPLVTGHVELARNVVDFVRMGNVGVQLVGDWYRGDTRLVVVPMSDYDLGTPLAEVQVTAPYGRMFVNGRYIYLVSSDYQTGDTTVHVVDMRDPTHPAITGTLTLPAQVDYWGGYMAWGIYGNDELIQVGGNKLVFHAFRYWYRGGPGCMDCGGGAVPGSGTGTSIPQYDQLFVVDLSNPTHPNIASTIDLVNEDWAFGLMAEGNTLYFTHYEDAGQSPSGQWLARYYLDRIDLSDPARPVKAPKVNVPGYVVGISSDLHTVYTLDYAWLSDGSMDEALNALTLSGNVAVLRDRLPLTGWIGNIIVSGQSAFLSDNRSWNDKKGQWHEESTLKAIDLSDPAHLNVASSSVMPEQYAWLRAVDGNRAFVDLGWMGGMLIYDVSDPTNLTLDTFDRHQGWVTAIHVDGAHAWLAAGYYGVRDIPLGIAQ